MEIQARASAHIAGADRGAFVVGRRRRITRERAAAHAVAKTAAKKTASGEYDSVCASSRCVCREDSGHGG